MTTKELIEITMQMTNFGQKVDARLGAKSIHVTGIAK